MPKKNAKRPSQKTDKGPVWENSHWKVRWGHLVPGRGRPHHVKSLFGWTGEKIPYEALDDVKARLRREEAKKEGVYMAHDSMGYARYVGRGDVFSRLAARKRVSPHELLYFSFYIVAEKKHEREIETLLIRLGGAHLEFNDRKKRVGIAPGNVRDYEAGTYYIERQKKRGPRRRNG
jgi:hypothetical protein